MNKNSKCRVHSMVPVCVISSRTLWSYETSDSIDDILHPDYFCNHSRALRMFDTIEVIVNNPEDGLAIVDCIVTNRLDNGLYQTYGHVRLKKDPEKQDELENKSEEEEVKQRKGK